MIHAQPMGHAILKATLVTVAVLKAASAQPLALQSRVFVTAADQHAKGC